MSTSQTIDIEQFLDLGNQFPIFDVRSPAEFEKAHIPGAHSLPLFSNEERALVGTIYKQSGRKAAMLKGLDLIGPKMRSMVETVQKISHKDTLLLHCWRGGMRSSSVAWLLSLFDYQVYLLAGGYKSFRHYVLQSFEIPKNIIILSGGTGSGKTDILKFLSKMGKQTIDLEALANHKGSSFGGLGNPPPPSQEQFENELAMQWRGLDLNRPVWMEDESQKIGARLVPHPLWQQMRHSPVIFLDMPIELRIQRLLREYGEYDKILLEQSIFKLKKRLGGQNLNRALEELNSNRLDHCCEILLQRYYDKSYHHGLSKREQNNIYYLPVTSNDAEQNAVKILEYARAQLNQYSTSQLHSS